MRDDRRVTRALFAVGVLLVFGSSTGAAPAQASRRAEGDPTRVKMIHFTFDPDTITVPEGTTEVWTYDESASDPEPNCESPEFQTPVVVCPGHSTTSSTLGTNNAPLWDSGVHRADGFPFQFTFAAAGTYPYYCSVHGGPNANNPLTAMNGTVVVTAANNAGSSEAAPPTTEASVAASRLPRTGGPAWLSVGLLVLGAAFLFRRFTRSADAT